MAVACPGCGATVETASSCPRCGFLIGAATIVATPPGRRDFTETEVPGGVRIVSRATFLLGCVMAVVAVFVLGISISGLLLGAWEAGVGLGGLGILFTALSVFGFISYSEITIDRESMTIRSFPVPGEAQGRHLRAAIADVGWNKTPARAGYLYSVELAMRDGRRLRMPLSVNSEGEAAFVVARVKAALSG